MASSINLKNANGKTLTLENSDTNTVDSTLNLMTGVYAIETVDDFDTVPAGIKTVVVKDVDRGGTFIWSSTGTADDNKVFAGSTGFWTRMRATYQPWVDTVSSGIYSYLGQHASLNESVKDSGGIGINVFTRTSAGSGGVGEAHIGISGMAYNDHIGGDAGAWALYGTALRAIGATGATHALELDIANTDTTVAVYPASMFLAGQTHGIWLGSGGESTATAGLVKTASCAIGIISNDPAGVANFDKGIIFHNKSILGCDGSTGEGIAISLAKGHKTTWFNNTNQSVGEIICTTETITKAVRLELSEYGTIFKDKATGASSFQIENIPSAINYLTAKASTTGVAVQLVTNGGDADIDLHLTSKGAGLVKYGWHNTTTDVPITGYIQIKDSTGTIRKLAVIA
jgi:hypothetical protein